MEQHLQLMDDILTRGRKKVDRTGVGTYSLFGGQMEFDLSDGFPLVTTRQMFLRGVTEELVWFLSGSTDNTVLADKNVKLWEQWALKEDVYRTVQLDNHTRACIASQILDRPLGDVIYTLNKKGDEKAGHAWLTSMGVPATQEVLLAKKGALGAIYGQQWRHWANPNGTTTDQIQDLLNNLANKRYSRRHIVTGWNPSFLPDETADHETNVLNGKAVLPPCHTMFQFIVEPLTQDERVEIVEKRMGRPLISAMMLARFSAGTDPQNIDAFLDEVQVPKDMLSLKLFARSQDVPVGTATNIASYSMLLLMVAKTLDMHPGRYIHSMGDSHVYTDQVELAKLQLTRSPKPLPTLELVDAPSSLFDYKLENFNLRDYVYDEKIVYPVAV